MIEQDEIAKPRELKPEFRPQDHILHSPARRGMECAECCDDPFCAAMREIQK